MTDKYVETLKNASEQELAKMKVLWPETIEELVEYIIVLSERQHDYGTAVYAMSMAAVATFNWMGKVLGASGFQASCADLDFLKRTRRMKDGFHVSNFSDLLYPQYFWNPEKFPTSAQILYANKEYFSKKAKQLLNESAAHAAPEVRLHWEWLANID